MITQCKYQQTLKSLFQRSAILASTSNQIKWTTQTDSPQFFSWCSHLYQTINCNCLLCTVWNITAVKLDICVTISEVSLKIRWQLPVTDLHFYIWRKRFEVPLTCCLFSLILLFHLLSGSWFWRILLLSFLFFVCTHSTCTTQDHRPHTATVKPALCLYFSGLLLRTQDPFFSYSSYLQYSFHYFHARLLPQLLFQHSWERIQGNTRVNFIFKLALKCIINLQLRGYWYFGYTLDHTVVRKLFSWYHWQLCPSVTQETVTIKSSQ